MRPKDLKAQHIWDYRLYIARTYKTPAVGFLTKKSQNFYLIALRALLRYLAERDIETLPSTKIKLAKQKNEETISFLELHEIEGMLKRPDTSKPEGLRDRAIMETLFSSGMRIAELVALGVDQVSLLMRGKELVDTHLRAFDRRQGEAHPHNLYLPARGALDPGLSRYPRR